VCHSQATESRTSMLTTIGACRKTTETLQMSPVQGRERRLGIKLGRNKSVLMLTNQMIETSSGVEQQTGACCVSPYVPRYLGKIRVTSADFGMGRCMFIQGNPYCHSIVTVLGSAKCDVPSASVSGCCLPPSALTIQTIVLSFRTTKVNHLKRMVCLHKGSLSNFVSLL